MKYFKFFLLIYFFTTVLASGEISQELIEKLKNTQSLSFKFKQQISDKIENGECKIKYSKLMLCDYEDSYKKRIISNGRTLAVIQRRYKKVFYYRLKKTPLNIILDKNFLIEIIQNTFPNKIDEKKIEFLINIDENRTLTIIFDKKTLNLKGWETSDIYNEDVKFTISDLESNIKIDEKIFRIPREEDL